jgi:hypothetical protein
MEEERARRVKEEREEEEVTSIFRSRFFRINSAVRN